MTALATNLEHARKKQVVVPGAKRLESAGMRRTPNASRGSVAPLPNCAKGLFSVCLALDVVLSPDVQAKAASLSVEQLRCEYLTDPLGIDARQPRLSWVLQSTQRAQKQTAYQILVATSTNNLAVNYGDMWNSGPVYSDQTIHVEYKGKALQTGQRLWWKVRSLDLYTGLVTRPR